jgi:hypothetical protein
MYFCLLFRIIIIRKMVFYLVQVQVQKSDSSFTTTLAVSRYQLLLLERNRIYEDTTNNVTYVYVNTLRKLDREEMATYNYSVSPTTRNLIKLISVAVEA